VLIALYQVSKSIYGALGGGKGGNVTGGICFIDIVCVIVHFLKSLIATRIIYTIIDIDIRIKAIKI